MSQEQRDKELLSAYKTGNEDAAALLFERYYWRLHDLVYRQLGWKLKEVEGPSDIVQSAFRTFFRRGKDGQIEIDLEGSLWPYLVTIAVSKVGNHVKFWSRQQRDQGRNVSITSGLDPLQREPTPEDVAILGELIGNLLTNFSDRRRVIVEMILQGHSPGEIAEALGTTRRTVHKTRLAAAKILEELLEKE